MQIRETLCRAYALTACIALLSCAPARSVNQPGTCQVSFGLCIAREVAASRVADGDTLIHAFVVSGAIDDIVRWSNSTDGAHRGFRFEMRDDFTALSDEGALAVVTLAAAAFKSTDPYTNREWLAVGGAFRNDPEVSHRAALMIRDLGYDPWESVLRNPPGLESIWRNILASAPDDFDTLLELSNELIYYGPASLKPLARQLIDRAIALPNLSPEQFAKAAGKLARHFQDPEAAQALMTAGGYGARDREVSGDGDLLAAAVEQHAIEQGEIDFKVTVVEVADIEGKDADIAMAYLRRGTYNADGARRVAQRLLDDDVIFPPYDLESLQRGGATKELDEIGNVWLQRARAAHGDAFEAVKLYAAASDAFRFAGNKEQAILAARAGMAFVPKALDNRQDIPDMAERRQLAGEDNGMRIAPAISLYRAGAEDEAIASGFTSGLELLKEWDKPLAEYDPQWIVDDTPKWLDVTISLVISQNDPAFANSVLNALATTPGAAEPMQLAVLAAAAGDAGQVRAHLDASLAEARSNPPGRHPSDEWFIMLRTVMAWKASEMLLATRTAH